MPSMFSSDIASAVSRRQTAAFHAKRRSTGSSSRRTSRRGVEPCLTSGGSPAFGTLDASLMGVIGHLRLSFWIVVIGTVVLYGFFVVVATIPPRQVAALTAVVAALAVAFTVRNVRLAAELADRGGDPHLRRALNPIRSGGASRLVSISVRDPGLLEFGWEPVRRDPGTRFGARR